MIYLTPEQVCEKLGCNTSKIKRFKDDGLVKPIGVQKGRRIWYYYDIEGFLRIGVLLKLQELGVSRFKINKHIKAQLPLKFSGSGVLVVSKKTLNAFYCDGIITCNPRTHEEFYTVEDRPILDKWKGW